MVETTQDTMTCQYQTGRILGRGNFAVVKEAVHIKTGEHFACKVISKKLMEGRENMVRTEISVLSKISSGHPNVVTLHDYFETANNLYLCFDLCTGGQLLQRVCSRGKFHEPDAANLVKKICGAVEFIHGCGIVHRDLKPENLLFDSPADDAEIMIADFGLSRVVEEDKLHAIIEVCGTPGYIAPEVYQQRGHGPAVDIWALGIITYFLLCGYIPLNRASTSKQLYDNKMSGIYAFEPERYWVNVSEAGKGFIRRCLEPDPERRPEAGVLAGDEWLADGKAHFVPDASCPSGLPADLLPQVKQASIERASWKKSLNSSLLAGEKSPGQKSLAESVFKQDAAAVTSILKTFIQEAEKEDPTKSVIIHHHRGARSLSLSGRNKQPVTPDKPVRPWQDGIRRNSSPEETDEAGEEAVDSVELDERLAEVADVDQGNDKRGGVRFTEGVLGGMYRHTT